jgi:cytochrome b6-f complex iron-sulfur subunit
MKQTPVLEKQIHPAKPRRRTFFTWLWGTLITIGCIEIGWVVGTIFKSRKQREETKRAEHLIEAGLIENYEPGSVTAVPEGQFYISRLDDGSFIALSKNCTHLGCSVPWDEKKQTFVCPCHGSTFDQTGKVLSSPAIRPLDYFPARIENGLLRVDIATPLKRQAFDPSQTVQM